MDQPMVLDWDRLPKAKREAVTHAHDLSGRCRKDRSGECSANG